MGKNRKGKQSNDANKQTGIDIPEEEQWRIIQESGILKQVPREQKPARMHKEGEEEEAEELSPFVDEMFNAFMLIIPMSFMLLLMDILVHSQYGRRPDLHDLADRLLPGVPIISVFVFYTNRYKANRWMQATFFLLACTSGSRLVWLMNRGNWLTVMKQSPPLATSWIYAVFQLNLVPSALSLVVVLAYGWYYGLKMMP